MLVFLASVLDQMDLALEHTRKASVHDARFGLMLTDNAVELALHELAKEKHAELKAWAYMREDYPHKKELEEAMGRSFEAKLRFAKLEGVVSEEQARTITLMHGFRNELYHVGLQHEAILPNLARFYFSVACGVLADYPIGYFSYWDGIQLPERSKKYFTSRDKYSPAEMGDFAKACRTMEAECGHKKGETIRTLADHMESIISGSDTDLDIVAEGVYTGQQRTRDQATIECQTWPLAFSTEGRDYAKANGFSGKSFRELLEWLGANYPLRFKKDPIPGWERQAARLRSKGNPHTALENYVAFMEHTAQIREAFSETAAAAEREIDRLIDMRRGK
ncbi:hypothetical protein GOA89_32535 [Sinorhizobium meliloti]|nr:hypothetical protein [Sinorhizobium meliloti]MDW9850848.1 hypothetical protein [Sinorhizobium meliloti]MDX0147658.1 hypothetical protein [Sinorhizobium meliloti]MDX0153927.1 hypothetical protein [Sinorhizobium meliloti]MDX0172839.1 hypothetical protein [Sinorhizobium meliloti]